MKYDDASWHYGGDFPATLPSEAGGTHIGMFLSWCILNGMAGTIHTEEFPEKLAQLKNRQTTPGAWFLSACDEKFTDEDLTDEGNAFTAAYYSGDNPEYISDYEKTVGVGLQSLYFVPDTWTTYDRLSTTISRRYKNWKNPPKWWEIWKRS